MANFIACYTIKKKMKHLLILLVVGFLMFACQDNKTNPEVTPEEVAFNQELANELEKMAVLDQIAANIPQGENKKLAKAQWKAFKDSVYTTHQIRLKQLLDQYGFVGKDLAGEEGSFNFWLMTQHCDHDPEFQREVLRAMKPQVDQGNADPSNYGYLVDRVNLNTGEAQIYGTQVDYNFDIAQAYPKNLADSANVNKRRAAIGLEPLENYLNQITLLHFDMNKQFYLDKGITEPKLYPTN